MTNNTPLETADGHELRMGLLDHLVELRDRMLRAMIMVIIGTVIGFFVADIGFGILQQPYCRIKPDDCLFQLLTPTDNVVVYFRVSLLIGASLAIPFVTYQLLMFILPGLTRKEKRIVFWSIPAITGLFVIGVVFAWYVLAPAALEFLATFWENRTYTEWTADGYFSFVTSLVFWMGVAFETPLVFFVLSLIGVVTSSALVKNWRIAIVGAAIAAAVITPTIDPVNMFLVMAPLLALYVLSIFLVMIGSRMNGVGRKA